MKYKYVLTTLMFLYAYDSKLPFEIVTMVLLSIWTLRDTVLCFWMGSS